MLCRKTFLRLWSYPNLYRDQGHGNSGEGKELCDLLVVFGDDVLIFSDKDCRINLEGELAVAWSRWYRQAVLKSSQQAMGAERWLREHPERVFVDRACKMGLPIDLPKEPRFHRILTCRGAAPASLAAFGGSGSLLVTNASLEACSDQPLHLGAIDAKGRLYHVIDEASLDDLLRTFDTVSDLVEYLCAREDFFRGSDSITAASESDLIGFYLFNYSEEEQKHDFRVERVDANPGSIFIADDFWDRWLASTQYKAKVAADTVSYSWDRLIEKFSFHMLTGTEYFAGSEPVRDREVLLRWMAREHRVRRRILAQSLIEAMHTTHAGQMRRQLILPSYADDPLWVFLVLPRPQAVEYEIYREHRRTLLKAHLKVAKFVRPEALDLMGLAVEPNDSEFSADAMYKDARYWSDEENEEARQIQIHTQFFISELPRGKTVYEFPIDDYQESD